ncbi:hypothetical protein, partial [Nocardia cyriacigeorgica]|uniref:hypothetical protein n=1 Tax=Nocardia cyriacigeorgica TaxID=135487 RepID=UPI0024581C44
MSGDIGSADAVTPDRVNVSAVLTTAQRPAWTKFGFICGRRHPHPVELVTDHGVEQDQRGAA